MALPIVRYNQPVLRKKGQKITAFNPALATLAGEMIATMHDAEGIGLAAQQVGQALMLCVLDLRAAKKDFTWKLDGARPPLDLFMPLVLANPVVTIAKDTDLYVYEEGCLSFPGVTEEIERAERVKVRALDRHGNAFELEADGLLAVAIQHENDHLEGKLMVDRVGMLKRRMIDRAMRKRAAEANA